MADKQPGIEAFVETKLTKGEAIDLLVVELRDQVVKETRDLEQSIKGISKTFKFSEIKELIPDDTPVCLRAGYDDASVVTISLGDRDYGDSFKAKLSKLPADVRARFDERERLSKEKSRLESLTHRLNDKKGDARTLIMRQMLESSAVGRQFLSIIKDLRLQVRPKFLPAKNG